MSHPTPAPIRRERVAARGVLVLLAAAWQASAQPAISSRPSKVESADHCAVLQIHNPADGVVFPPEMPPPAFTRADPCHEAAAWRIDVAPANRPVTLASNVMAVPCWTPDSGTWTRMKAESVEAAAVVSIVGFRLESPQRVLSRGSVRIHTSKDEVGAPLFYREVNLPFLDAVKDPSRIRWRFGPISSASPR